MDILGFIRGEALEIIEFNDDSRDTLSWRFPDEDKAIKNGAQLVVRESQVAQFVYLGQFGDCFSPGTHSLITENIPFLTRLKGWKYAFQSPFKADVYYVTTRLFTGNTCKSTPTIRAAPSSTSLSPFGLPPTPTARNHSRSWSTATPEKWPASFR